MRDLFKIRGDRPAARIQEVFEQEATKRRDGRSCEEWIEAEMMAVFRAVMEERARLGKGPVPLEEVRKAESSARGHVDYSMKWALYCEELVRAP